MRGENGRKSAVYTAVNEHFEPIFNEAVATQVAFRKRELIWRNHWRTSCWVPVW